MTVLAEAGGTPGETVTGRKDGADRGSGRHLTLSQFGALLGVSQQKRERLDRGITTESDLLWKEVQGLRAAFDVLQARVERRLPDAGESL